MRILTRVAPLLAMMIGLAPIPAPEASVDAPISADAHVRGDSDVAARGGSQQIKVDGAGGSAWLSFDLSTLPGAVTGADVADATLVLWVRKVVRPGDLGVRIVLDPWAESSLTGESVPAAIEDLLAMATVSSKREGGFLALDVTDIVRGWVDGAVPNNGVALVAAGGKGSFVFDSKESVRGGHEPRLEIELGTPGGQPSPEPPLLLKGPEGIPGPDGPQGPAGLQGGSLNPMKVARNLWHEANDTGEQVWTGSHPINGLFAGGSMWFVNWEANQVRKLDPLTGSSVGFWAGSGPNAMASDTISVWVLNYISGTITRLRLVDGADLGSLAVGNGPTGIAFDGTNMWVANNVAGTIAKIRASDQEILATYPLAGGPRRILFDGTELWITLSQGDSLARMRPSDGAVLATYGGFANPIGVASDGERIWVANFDDRVVNAISAIDGEVIHTVDIGWDVFDVLFDGVDIWASSAYEDLVKKIRPADGMVLGVYPAGDTPEGLVFDGTRVWVSNSRSNSAHRY